MGMGNGDRRRYSWNLPRSEAFPPWFVQIHRNELSLFSLLLMYVDVVAALDVFVAVVPRK